MQERILKIIYDLLTVERSLDREGQNINMAMHHVDEAKLYMLKLLKVAKLEFVNEEVSELRSLSDINSVLELLDYIQVRILALRNSGTLLKADPSCRYICDFAYQSTVIAGSWLIADFNSMLPNFKEKEEYKQTYEVTEFDTVNKSLTITPVDEVTNKPSIIKAPVNKGEETPKEEE